MGGGLAVVGSGYGCRFRRRRRRGAPLARTGGVLRPLEFGRRLERCLLRRAKAWTGTRRDTRAVRDASEELLFVSRGRSRCGHLSVTDDWMDDRCGGPQRGGVSIKSDKQEGKGIKRELIINIYVVYVKARDKHRITDIFST